MTRLRDDGYLEIGAEPRDDSDWVVASCFIDYEVTVRDQHHLLILNVSKIGIHINGNQGIFRYPILIPAKTVAEVVDTGDEFSNLVLGSIGMYEHPTYTLNDWLCAHTEEKS